MSYHAMKIRMRTQRIDQQIFIAERLLRQVFAKKKLGVREQNYYRPKLLLYIQFEKAHTIHVY